MSGCVEQYSTGTSNKLAQVTDWGNCLIRTCSMTMRRLNPFPISFFLYLERFFVLKCISSSISKSSNVDPCGKSATKPSN